MAITASFSPNAKLLLVSSDNADDVITISCDAAGQILVNGGAVSIWGGQPTIANTAEIQVFSKGGEGKIVRSPTVPCRQLNYSTRMMTKYGMARLAFKSWLATIA